MKAREKEFDDRIKTWSVVVFDILVAPSINEDD